VTLLETKASVEDILRTLDRWIECEIMDVIHEEVRFSDETSCARAGECVQDASGVWHLHVECNKNRPRPCTIERFWSSRGRHLEAIAEMPKDGPQHVRQAAIAAEGVRNGESPRGNTCAYHLSDAVIACESPEGCDIATTNVQDLAALVTAIGGDRAVLNPISSDARFRRGP
jgi:hypothetical protein